MSIPHPSVQIRMYKEMMERNYKFNIDDKVMLHSNFENQSSEGNICTINFPLYYLQTGSWSNKEQQAYVMHETPCPYTEKELILIKSSGKTREDIMRYLEELIEKAKNDTTWVPA